ncbi:MAG TPA: efflux RND transporter periplasmic adaptor subunit [Gemmatimonadaceae bacterium]|nr:efflux RND transporter periplasmic adaptor subunit [Gemmatimonadaceae bacterium]
MTHTSTPESAMSIKVARTLTVALMAAFAACKGGNAAETESSAAAETATIGTENIALVTSGVLQSGPTVSGALLPEREASVRAQVGGSILQTLVDQGQAVRAGQTLARIEAGGLQDVFLSARAGVTAASNNADIARRELARAEKLLAAGAIAERDIEQARRSAISANAALADSRARLATAQKQVGNTVVSSPINGIVSERAISSGDVVQPGGPLFTVVDPSSMRLEGSVPAEQLSQVRVGAPVSFTVNGYPGRTFTGRVTRVNPTADPATRQVRVVISIPNAEGRLVGGLFAQGRLASESRTGMVVPVTAVDSRSNVPAVFRIKGGKVERVPVQLGLRDEGSERIEIASGVQAGDTLLLGAAQGITPGTIVKVSAPSDKAPAKL